MESLITAHTDESTRPHSDIYKYPDLVKRCESLHYAKDLGNRENDLFKFFDFFFFFFFHVITSNVQSNMPKSLRWTPWERMPGYTFTVLIFQNILPFRWQVPRASEK